MRSYNLSLISNCIIPIQSVKWLIAAWSGTKYWWCSHTVTADERLSIRVHINENKHCASGLCVHVNANTHCASGSYNTLLPILAFSIKCQPPIFPTKRTLCLADISILL